MTTSGPKRLSIGWIYALLAQVAWGSSSVVISSISKSLPTTLLVSLRHGLGAMFLGSNVLAGKSNIFRHQPWIHLIILGLLAGSFPDLFLVESVRHAGPVVAVMLARLEIPLGVLLAHLLLKEQVTSRAYSASLVGVVGAAFISYKPGLAIDLTSGFYFGIAMGIGAGLSWSLSSVYAKYILNLKADPLAVTFVRMCLGSLTALLLTILFVSQPFKTLGLLRLHDWLLIIYLGLVASGLGYLLFYRSLNLIDAHIAQILLGISMATAVLLSLIIGIHVTPLQWVGILIIAWSIYMIRRPPPAVEPLD